MINMNLSLCQEAQLWDFFQQLPEVCIKTKKKSNPLNESFECVCVCVISQKVVTETEKQGNGENCQKSRGKVEP